VLQNAKDFDCSTCTWGRFCDESNPAPFETFVIEGVIESKTCFLPMITDLSMFFARLYRHYKNGILYHGGGFADQPNKYLEAMELIETESK